MTDSETTESNRYFVINGRRWRKTDPSIPPLLLKQLIRELMSARRAVKSAKAADNDEMMALARQRVSDAKISLGERGHPWWECTTEQSLAIRLEATIRCLLRSREDGKTICPSEAARVVGSAQWRDILPITIERIWALERSGWLHVTQKGERVRYPTIGAIRLRRC